MAKKSVVARDLKRRCLFEKFKDRRSALKAKASDSSLTFEERFDARLQMTLLPRNSSPVRRKNRCGITGRSGSYYRDFGVSRIALRELASRAQVPGVTKSSW